VPLTAAEAGSDFHRAYLDAYARMEAGDPGALEAFRRLAEERPEDGPVRLHLERLEAGARSGLVVMHDK